MLYKYEATTPEGKSKFGTIEAANLDLAVSNLQRQNLVIIHIEEAGKKPFFSRQLAFLGRVKKREIVLLSRQIATLFEAKVPVIDSLRLLISETPNPFLRSKLEEIMADVQAGLSISQSLGRHPDLFSDFYVSMVRSGEESGKLAEAFSDIAEHLEYSFDVSAKIRNALLYPAFVFTTFVVVMILMLVVIIPKVSSVVIETNQVVPWYTSLIIFSGEFLRQFGIYILIAVIFALIFLFRYIRTNIGKQWFARFQLNLPVLGKILQKLYLSRTMSNLETLLSSGLPVIKAFEVTADVAGNEVYATIFRESTDSIKAGSSISDVLARYEDMPSIVSRMLRVGEETGELGFILKTLSRFYKKEAENAIDNLINMLEPIMIIVLGLGVGLLVAGILGPIYNIASTIG